MNLSPAKKILLIIAVIFLYSREKALPTNGILLKAVLILN